MSTSETIIITGSATVDDIQPLSDEGSQTFLLYGKKVKLLNKSGKKVKRIDIDGRRMYQKQEGLPTADISRIWVNGGQVITGQATIGDLTDIVTYADTKREWVNGGQVITGQATIGDLTDIVTYADTKREWVNGGLVVTGSATIGDTDSTVVYGDTVRDNLVYGVSTGSIDYTTHAITYGINSPTNKIFVVSCAPSTTYDITMNMYSRFRVASYAGIPADGTVLSTYAINSLDTNSNTTQSGSSQTVSITTGASDTYLFIQYWTSTDTVSSDTIEATIGVTSPVTKDYGDVSGYIKYGTHAIVISSQTTSSADTNRLAVFECSPSTTYTITMNMYSRFRVASYTAITSTTTGTTSNNYVYDSLDDNSTTSQGGASHTVTLTTGSNHTRLYIGYWTTADSATSDVIRSSIVVLHKLK